MAKSHLLIANGCKLRLLQLDCHAQSEHCDRTFYSRVIVSFHQPIHDFAGFGEGKDYALVVLEVALGENTAFAILEPLLRWTITADRLLPRLDRHIVEILRRVDVDAAIFPFNLVNGVISGDREPRARLA